MQKRTVLKKIIEKLKKDVELYTRAARAAHAEATHEQNKAENKYDTRGLEASYLARGQAKSVAETEVSISQFESLPTADLDPSLPIAVGSLVELKGDDGTAWYFLGPRAGGTEVVIDRIEILVITPQSPLGQQLLGHHSGERLKLEIAGTRKLHHIVSTR